MPSLVLLRGQDLFSEWHIWIMENGPYIKLRLKIGYHLDQYLVFIAPTPPHLKIFSLPIHSWCKLNSLSKFNTEYTPSPRSTIFDFTIWLGHNSLVFEGQNIPPHILRKNSLSHAIKFYFLSNIPAQYIHI